MDAISNPYLQGTWRENEYQSVLNLQKKGCASSRTVNDEHIQFLHDGRNHWFLSFCSNGRIQICDSLRTTLSRVSQKCVNELYRNCKDEWGKMVVSFRTSRLNSLENEDSRVLNFRVLIFRDTSTPRFSHKIRSVLWFWVPLYFLYFTRSAKKFLVRVTYISIVRVTYISIVRVTYISIVRVTYISIMQHHWSIKIFTRVLQAYSTKLYKTYNDNERYGTLIHSNHGHPSCSVPLLLRDSGGFRWGGGAMGHGPGPRAFYAQKGPRTFSPPPNAFVRMSKSIR